MKSLADEFHEKWDEVGKETLATLKSGGLSEGDVLGVIGKGFVQEICHYLQRQSEKNKREELAKKPHPITILENQKIRELIKRGKYSVKCWDMTQKNFPDIEPVGDHEMFLVPFEMSVWPARALDEVVSKGFAPATIGQFLEFGARYPDIQKIFPVFSICTSQKFRNGRNFVVCLTGNDSYRYVHIYGFDTGVIWGERGVFGNIACCLAYRKKETPTP